MGFKLKTAIFALIFSINFLVPYDLMEMLHSLGEIQEIDNSLERYERFLELRDPFYDRKGNPAVDKFIEAIEGSEEQIGSVSNDLRMFISSVLKENEQKKAKLQEVVLRYEERALEEINKPDAWFLRKGLSDYRELVFADRLSSFMPFQPFIQKLIVPENKKIKLIVIGDLHGEKVCLSNILNMLEGEKIIDSNGKIIDPNCYLVFLGDYLDRGDDGVQTLIDVLEIKLRNFENVFLLRGNHEHFTCFRASDEMYFELELENIGFSELEALNIYKVFELFPASLSLVHGGDVFCFMHGGLQHGLEINSFLNERNPAKKFTLVGIRKGEQTFVQHYEDETKSVEERPLTSPLDLELLWVDFHEGEGYESDSYTFRNSLGTDITRKLLEEYTKCIPYQIKAVFRGHDHDAANSGVSKMGDKVYTVVSSPPLLEGTQGYSCAEVCISSRGKFELKKAPFTVSQLSDGRRRAVVDRAAAGPSGE
ncbi:serine/threonine protein phosphatase [Candidatus Babeliales bacterium]|nr:serine/threonine protein phosphatase [Candidatus Babeliales bacterium]